jgi:hypothetical protein
MSVDTGSVKLPVFFPSFFLVSRLRRDSLPGNQDRRS